MLVRYPTAIGFNPLESISRGIRVPESFFISKEAFNSNEPDYDQLMIIANGCNKNVQVAEFSFINYNNFEHCKEINCRLPVIRVNTSRKFIFVS